ncbi:MAG: Hpt domain-containing protein [Lachnospiraceae bacterium]|nr:Hpt domain-containing protein [Lachnospiraceae bacterium]MBR1568163.1 Hpt domain-containing protein [Lachnospiraceae bacterium]
MLTVDAMKAFGADTETALTRCAGSEALYLRLVGKVPDSEDFDKLEAAVKAKDYDAAFNLAHGLKGILLNLSITPIADPVSEMTELLRSRKDMDYSPYIQKMQAERKKLTELCKS